jgi:hypothetical protein
MVLVGSGVNVGVQVAVEIWNIVGEGVGRETKAGRIGGGKGLIVIVGLTKIIVTTRTTQIKEIKTRTVRTFQVLEPLSRDRWTVRLWKLDESIGLMKSTGSRSQFHFDSVVPLASPARLSPAKQGGRQGSWSL